MKKIFLFGFLLFFGLASCNQDDKEPEFTINGYWNLVQMIPAWQIPEMPEKQIDFEEKYIFNHDGTFIKFSYKPKGIGDKLEVPTQALGVYSFETYEEKNETILYVLYLRFDTNINMAANCGEGARETLYVRNDRSLINNSWAACDGPSYVYSKGR
ncbi:hypothetical protein [Cecembia rubra]|uniref:Lipocalin-like protein n=1 Tax=Cecembia rubra TaxID=1485585 RepID=A0A2P8E9V5_9BACT|nr:hypothetical protein [Cecembia rubra]PSL06251.1 hypothetical protein CLV48_10266 [Cecembia rubra]